MIDILLVTIGVAISLHLLFKEERNEATDK